MTSGSTRTRSGTMFEIEPAERRSGAVVRAETGRLSATSVAAFMRARYAAKAATTIGTSVELALPARSATAAVTSAVSSAPTCRHGIVGAADPGASVTGGGRSTRRRAQCSRSAACRVLPT